MVLEKQKQAIILSSSKSATIDMSLDEDSTQILMQMLSKNLYSDAEGSIIREWTCNALDSHRRVNSKYPILVSLKSNLDSGYDFTVEDFGSGLSNYEVETILSKYGKSTKRESNVEIGAMGLGFKSGLAYSSVFYFICRKDGIENKYMMYEGEFKNAIDLLYTKETTERNGVKMILRIKNSDFRTFFSKIKEQLCYFENVYFDIDNNSINSFTIHRDINYQISSLNTDSNLHISLDDVYYPINFSKLGIPEIQFPIALRFALSDEIYPIPNREQIQYTAKTKEIILKKLKIVSNELVKSYNKKINELKTIKEFVNYCETSGKYLTLNEKCCNILNIESYSKEAIVNPTLEYFKHLDFVNLYKSTHNYLLSDFSLTHVLNDNAIRKPSTHFDKFILRKIEKNNTQIYLVDVPITNAQKNYIKSTAYNGSFFIEEKKCRKLGSPSRKYNFDGYHALLDLKDFPKDIWRDVIKEFQFFIEVFKKENCIKISSVEVPKEFLEGFKNKRTVSRKEKTERVKGSLVCKLAVSYTHDSLKCKFVEKTYKLENVSRLNQFVVYSGVEKIETIKQFFPIFTNINFITLNLKDLKMIKELKNHNFISMEEFEKGNSKYFKKVVTAWLIQDFISENKYIFESIPLLFQCCTILARDLKMLKHYQEDCLKKNYVSDTLRTSIIEIATKNNLFDFSMYYDYLRIKQNLKKLNYLEDFISITNQYSKNEEKLVKILNMLFKYNKQRINLEHYNVKIN